MSESNLGSYEMLWDCHYCDAKKLLGLTHRHCPNCGASQDPSWRYFPSDAEKVAVKDHVFTGADRKCPSCENPASAKAKHCPNCGGPLEGGKSIAQRADQVRGAAEQFAAENEADAKREQQAGHKPAAKAPPPAAPPKKGVSALGIVLGLVFVLVIGLILVFVFWTKEVALTATGHTWSREIDIMEFKAITEWEWCDKMPSGAYNVSRSREVRSKRQIPDGEDCQVRRRDNGDGTFSEKKECKTRYRDEPVYDDKCRFTSNQWTKSRAVKAEGASVAQQPVWPPFTLNARGQTLGSEREGPRRESYLVHFKLQDNKSDSCGFPAQEWAQIPVGSQWKGEQSLLTGTLSCRTLQRMK